MKQGRSIAEVLRELQRQNTMKRDFITPARALHLEDDGRTFVMNGVPGANVNGGSVASEESAGNTMVLDTTPLFHRQVASSLGIPAKYYDLMQDQKPELLADNVNSWLSDRDQNYMVRSMRGMGSVNGETELVDTGVNTSLLARAFLSDRYRRIDNMDVAATVLPLFAGSDQFEIVSSEVTSVRMYIKILNHRLEAEVKPGDYVQAGVVISNSEVGLGAVSVQPLLYRLVCTNGMVINDFGQRKHHIGRAAKVMDDSFELYSDATIEAEDKAFLLKLQDVTRAAIEETRFNQIVDTLRESTDARITGPVQDVVELTGKSLGITQDEQDGVLKYLIEGGDLSLYGLSNAFTRFSQDVESYDRATALEGMGWQVATMPKTQWKEINR